MIIEYNYILNWYNISGKEPLELVKSGKKIFNSILVMLLFLKKKRKE